MHVIEILALGPELRREAEAQCSSINEAHFVVHEVLSHALAEDAVDIATQALNDEFRRACVTR